MIRCLLLFLALMATTALPALTQDIQEIESGVVRIVNPELKAQGTGFIVSITRDRSRIFIVTAAHIVRDAEYFDVYLPGDSTVAVRGKLFKKPEEGETKGLALLVVVGDKQQFSDLTALEIGETLGLKGSESVQVFGFPEGREDYIVIVGNVAGHDGRYLVISGSNISEGNSGGPVVLNGKVVGLITDVRSFAYAEKGESIRIFVSGSGVTLPATQIAQPADEFCQALSKLVDAAPDGFKKIKDNKFESTIRLPGAIRKGKVTPDFIVRYPMKESKKKSEVEENFNQLKFKIRNCFEEKWEEKERTHTMQGVYSERETVPANAFAVRHHYFRSPEKKLEIILAYNLKTQSRYFLTLTVDKDSP